MKQGLYNDTNYVLLTYTSSLKTVMSETKSAKPEPSKPGQTDLA